MKTNIQLLNDIKDNYFNKNAKYFARKYNLSEVYIRSLASDLKVTQKYQLESKKLKIIKEYKNGISIKDLYLKFGHSEQTIKKILIKEDCLIRDKRTSHLIFHINENYFEKIDSHEKAYWLGFIYADGNIYKNKLQIGLSNKDKIVLINFSKSINSNYKLYKDNNNSIKFVVRNNKIVNDLKNLGVIPKKSLKLEFPNQNQLPNQFFWSFLLGYFDGDGCIQHIKTKNKKGHNIISWRFQLISTKEFLSFIKNLLDNKLQRNGCLYKEKRSKNNVWYLVYGGSCVTKKGKKVPIHLMNLLYQNIDIALKRKQKIFKKICN